LYRLETTGFDRLLYGPEGGGQPLSGSAAGPPKRGIPGWNFSFKEEIIESKEAAYECF